MDVKRDQSARVIQRAWRRFIDRQVYAYYRDLINFRARSDPATILHFITPGEAKLADSASGLYVKFRLIGDKFPPNVAYKIYTKRPICDIGAFAPRDYTRRKKQVGKVVNCRLDPKDYKNLKPDDSEWYKRFENNGWRLISNRVLFGMVETANSDESSRQDASPEKDPKKAKDPLFRSFHHDRFQRENLKAGRIRRTKVQWLKKSSVTKAMGTSEHPLETVSRIDERGGNKSVQRPPSFAHATKSATTRNTATPLINVIDEDTVDNDEEPTYVDDDDDRSLHVTSDDDAEVSNLVLWTSHLDFENYLTDWSTLGTTHISAATFLKLSS